MRVVYAALASGHAGIKGARKARELRAPRECDVRVCGVCVRALHVVPPRATDIKGAGAREP